MSTGALLFMIASWSFVLGLTGWAFSRLLRLQGKANVVEDAEDES